MGTPNLNNPFDQNPPRRPGILSDFGVDCVDDVEQPPDEETDPTSAAWNAMRWSLGALANLLPHTVVTIDYSGGNPIIVGVRSAISIVDGSTNVFTIARTGGGGLAAGDISLTYVVGTPAQFYGFTDPTADAYVTVVRNVEIDRQRAFPLTGGTTGWRIRTQLGATGFDVRCNLWIA